MQLNHLLVLALSASAYANNVASGVSCWKSGPTVSVSNISPHIETICNYLAGAAYVPKEERNQCVQDDAGIMWNFALTVREATNLSSCLIQGVRCLTSFFLVHQYRRDSTHHLD